MEKRPEKLTAEIVLRDYGALIRNTIRGFQVAAEEEDCYAEVLAAMITPSKKWGSNYLERYDPELACASTYITRLVINHMKGIYRTERRGSGRANKEAVSITSGAGRLADLLPDGEEEAGEEAERRILHRSLIKRLYTKKNKEFYSKSSGGAKRSTFRMCMMMLQGDLDVVSIARELEVTPAEVRRRLKLLANDPSIRMLAEDNGWKLSAA